MGRDDIGSRCTSYVNWMSRDNIFINEMLNGLVDMIQLYETC